ncbi:hypothetical protein [Streptomyces sp. NPDC026673]|uniref:hypothetical protein n=1 Tax=Streptomyces sp. NPDC026673 TaxID=3155724 RepID=UPI0033DE5C3D
MTTDRTPHGPAQEAATDELARLVDRLARTTGTAPEAVLARIPDELLNGLFLLRAHQVRTAANRAAHGSFLR